MPKHGHYRYKNGEYYETNVHLPLALLFILRSLLPREFNFSTFSIRWAVKNTFLKAFIVHKGHGGHVARAKKRLSFFIERIGAYQKLYLSTDRSRTFAARA